MPRFAEREGADRPSARPTRSRKVHLTTFIRRAFRRAPSQSPLDNRESIREELFSVERLEQHARSLAVAQPVTPKPTKGRPLMGRLTPF